MKRLSFARSFCHLGYLSFSSLLATTVAAQDATSSAPLTGQQEIILIEGEKLSRSLKDTPSSVALVRARDIERTMEDSSITDALQGIPNVTYSGTVNGVPAIRGQETRGPNRDANAFFGGTVPRATINLDGHYLSYSEYVYGATSLWDIEQIEVFRGPQTSSQGANSIAGSIIVKSKDPTFTPEGTIRAEYGSYNTVRASAAYSAALTDDLAFRVALDHTGRDTFIDYTNPSFDNGPETDLDFSSQMARIKLLYQPEQIPDLDIKYSYSHNRTNRPTYEAANQPFEDLKNNLTSLPTWRQRVNTHLVDIHYDLSDKISLFNQTHYATTSTKRTTFPANNGSANINQQNIANETRLSYGHQQDDLQAVVGYRYSHTKSDEDLDFRGQTDYEDIKDDLGLFTEVSYRVIDDLTLSGGLRYERNHVTRNGISAFASSELSLDETYTAILPKVSASYNVTPEVTIGGSVSKGYNPGGVTLNLVSRDYITFDAETLWNYEIFTRASFLDNSLNLNANMYYMDMSNAQRYISGTFAGQQYFQTVNAEKAHSYGLEISADYQPIDTLRFTAGLGLMQTEIREFSKVAAYEGNHFSKAPEYSFNFGADWQIMPDLMLSGDMHYTADYESEDANNDAHRIESFMLANARLAYNVTDDVQFYGYVTNIFDKKTPTFIQTNRSAGQQGSMTEPRMLGIGVKANF